MKYLTSAFTYLSCVYLSAYLGPGFSSACGRPIACSPNPMWWRCLPSTLRWLLRSHGSNSAKPKARRWSVSACAADNRASVTLRPKSVCSGAKAHDGFVTRHVAAFKRWNCGRHLFPRPLNCVTSFVLCHMTRFFSNFLCGKFSAARLYHQDVLGSYLRQFLSHWRVFFYTPLNLFEIHIAQCFHGMFYLTRFVVSLHLCDTLPQ